MKRFLRKIIKKKKLNDVDHNIVLDIPEPFIEEYDLRDKEVTITIPPANNGKHLICDDASSNRMVLRRYLEQYKCIVEESENGLEAIDKVKDNGEYRIIWMDIKMPKMDGLKCTKILRDEVGYKGAIIALTGYVDEITVKQCFEQGMNHVVPKPFDKAIIYSYCEKYN